MVDPSSDVTLRRQMASAEQNETLRPFLLALPIYTDNRAVAYDSRASIARGGATILGRGDASRHGGGIVYGYGDAGHSGSAVFRWRTPIGGQQSNADRLSLWNLRREIEAVEALVQAEEMEPLELEYVD
jgi:hypothetical protein